MYFSTSAGIPARIISMPQLATSKPTAAPASERRTLSVINCATSLHRPAPSAVRTASSRLAGFGRHGIGRPHFRGLGENEVRRHHSHDFVILVIQADGFPGDTWVA